MPARPRKLTPDRSARHLFGSEMRSLRDAQGMSLERLAAVVKYSRSALSRFETAESMIPPDLPGRLDAAFGTDGLFDKLYPLTRREIHPDQFRRRHELEACARRIETYTCQLVPGLAQTEDYARSLFEIYDPRATTEQVAELVTARMIRQSTIQEADPAPDVAFILDEAVIRRVYGGPEVMRAQLARLADMALTPTTVVQVLPFAHGGHALAGGSLALMTLDDGSQVAYEEAISTGTLIDDMDAISGYRRAYDLLRACALSPKESAAFIRSVMEELPT